MNTSTSNRFGKLLLGTLVLGVSVTHGVWAAPQGEVKIGLNAPATGP